MFYSCVSPQDLSTLQCDVCVLVFSVTDRRSFHRTAQLRLLLRESQPHTPIILVGNKSDLVRSREISSEGTWRAGRRRAGFLSRFQVAASTGDRSLVSGNDEHIRRVSSGVPHGCKSSVQRRESCPCPTES